MKSSKEPVNLVIIMTIVLWSVCAGLLILLFVAIAARNLFNAI